jgi:hypothetical protein
MFTGLPHKKMEKVKAFGFAAKCDCGHQHKFKSSEIDLNKSDSSTAILKDIYVCPKCKTTYNGIFENIQNRNVWYRNLSPVGVLISIILLFGLSYGGYKVFNYVTTPNVTDYKNATNKEIQDFNKWDQKQQQKKWEDSPAFNSKD